MTGAGWHIHKYIHMVLQGSKVFHSNVSAGFLRQHLQCSYSLSKIQNLGGPERSEEKIQCFIEEALYIIYLKFTYIFSQILLFLFAGFLYIYIISVHFVDPDVSLKYSLKIRRYMNREAFDLKQGVKVPAALQHCALRKSPCRPCLLFVLFFFIFLLPVFLDICNQFNRVDRLQLYQKPLLFQFLRTNIQLENKMSVLKCL